MPSASAWATQARSDARTSRWDAAGQAATRIAAAATAMAATRATLPRSAAATSDGPRAEGFRAAEGGLRCREAVPAWPGDDRGGLRGTGPALGWTANPTP